jgi:hypothetical protein
MLKNSDHGGNFLDVALSAFKNTSNNWSKNFAWWPYTGFAEYLLKVFPLNKLYLWSVRRIRSILTESGSVLKLATFPEFRKYPDPERSFSSGSSHGQ